MTSEEMVARSTLRSSYVHGFKTRARRVADQLRADTGHNDREPLDTSRVLAHLQLRRWRLSAFADQTADLWVAAAQLYVVDSSAFSGALIGEGDNRAILVNDAHTEVRQRATEAHEAGHAILGHSNTPFLSGSMVRLRDAQIEAEADFLGMCLLVPEAYTLSVARRHAHADAAGRRIAVQRAALEMNVSTEMMQWAFNSSGAWQRSKRRARAGS